MEVYLASTNMSQQVLLWISKGNKLMISCPSMDIFNKECPKYEISDQLFNFYFQSCKYELGSGLADSNVFKMKNLIYGYTEYVIFKSVKENEFGLLNMPINRKQLIVEHKYRMQTKKVDFSYQFNDPKINLIKSRVNMADWLESYDDFSKMKSVLSWVNDTVQHKSYMILPEKRDTLSLLEFAKENRNKLNCRGLAILLSELCLAAGLHAKYVACSPIEIHPDDIHVVVIAFSRELSKWILLDPTFCLVLYNSEEIPLSLCEFREYVVNDQKIIVDHKANYYGEQLNINKYLSDMLVKLYRFGSLVSMKIGGDESFNEQSIELVPDTRHYPDLLNVISDPDVFWGIPNIFNE